MNIFTFSREQYDRLESLALDVTPSHEVRYYLNGVHFTGRDGVLHAEATNGHMLVRLNLHQPYGGPDVIVSRDAFKVVRSLRSKTKRAPGATLVLGLDECNIEFTPRKPGITHSLGEVRECKRANSFSSIPPKWVPCTGADLCKYVDGKFPDTDRVLPKDSHLDHTAVYEPYPVDGEHSKANEHNNKMCETAQALVGEGAWFSMVPRDDKTGRWECFYWKSPDALALVMGVRQ